jgi:hypothetical protein
MRHDSRQDDQGYPYTMTTHLGAPAPSYPGLEFNRTMYHSHQYMDSQGHFEIPPANTNANDQSGTETSLMFNTLPANGNSYNFLEDWVTDPTPPSEFEQLPYINAQL